MAVSLGLVAASRAIGFGYGVTALAMFGFDFLTAAVLWQLCLRCRQDLTLGREYRSATNQVFRRSRVLGVSAWTLLVLKCIAWDGPERMVEFLHIELEDRHLLAWSTLATLALLQALFWTSVYWIAAQVFAA